MKYLSTFEIAEKWGISPRRVGVLCNQDRIPGAQRAGSRWIIPENAEKHSDAQRCPHQERKIQKRNEVICLWRSNIFPVTPHNCGCKI